MDNIKFKDSVLSLLPYAKYVTKVWGKWNLLWFWTGVNINERNMIINLNKNTGGLKLYKDGYNNFLSSDAGESEFLVKQDTKYCYFSWSWESHLICDTWSQKIKQRNGLDAILDEIKLTALIFNSDQELKSWLTALDRTNQKTLRFSIRLSDRIAGIRISLDPDYVLGTVEGYNKEEKDKIRNQNTLMWGKFSVKTLTGKDTLNAVKMLGKNIFTKLPLTDGLFDGPHRTVDSDQSITIDSIPNITDSLMEYNTETPTYDNREVPTQMVNEIPNTTDIAVNALRNTFYLPEGHIQPNSGRWKWRSNEEQQ